MPKTKRILIVEDDQFLVKVYTTKLNKEGFEIQMAISGEEVMEKVKTFKPNLILLDIMLPGQNGFEVLEALKKERKTKKIPVIILSNLGQDSDVKKGMELGAVDYFIKTDLSINDVVSKIKSAMK
jgi:DNA-binding response OmpR family regulator